MDFGDRTLSELENLDIDQVIEDHPSRLDQILWRIAFCLICLLFIWVTSATVTSAFISMAIPTPSVSQTTDRWEALMNVAQSQIEESHKCTEIVYSNCIVQSDEGIKQFQVKMREIVQESQSALSIGAQLLDICQSQYSRVLDQFSWHMLKGFQVFYDSTCSEQEIRQLKQVIGDDSSTLRFSLDKIQHQQEQWKGKMDSFSSDSIRDIDYKSEFQQLSNLSLSRALRDINSTYDDLTEYGRNVNPPSNPFPDSFSFDLALPVDSMSSIHGSLPSSEILQSLKSTWSATFDQIKSLGLDIDFPPVEGVFPSSSLGISAFRGALQSALSTAQSEITNPIQSVVLDIRNQILLSCYQAGAQLEQGASLLSNVTTLFADYDPPPLNFNTAILDGLNFNFPVPTFQDWGLGISTKTQKAKKEAREAAASIVSLFRSIPEKLSNIRLPQLDSVDWALGSVTGAVQPAIDLLNTVWKILLFYDIVYRVTSTLKTLFFYGKATFSQLPVLDLRQSDNQGGLLDTISRLPVTMLGPAVMLFVLIAFFLTLTVIVVVKYVKLYSSYVQGCVTSKTGTFFTHNANHLASNLLNDTASAVLLSYEQKYTEQTYSDCQSATSDSESTLTQGNYKLAFQQQEFLTFNQNLQLINKCINPTLTYTHISQNDPGPFLQTDPQNPVLINKAVINAMLRDQCPEIWLSNYPWTANQLEMGTSSSCLPFIPSCSIQDRCSPSFSPVSVASQYAACDSEWHLHSTVIKLFLTIVVMICLNVARIFVMKFLVTWFFCELGTINVEVLLNYRFRTMQCSMSETKVREEIANLIKGHKKKALIYLLGALLCQIPYLFAIFWFLNFSAPMR